MRPRQARAARLNPARGLVTGTVCDVRVEQIEEPTMRLIRIFGSEAERNSQTGGRAGGSEAGPQGLREGDGEDFAGGGGGEEWVSH